MIYDVLPRNMKRIIIVLTILLSGCATENMPKLPIFDRISMPVGMDHVGLIPINKNMVMSLGDKKGNVLYSIGISKPLADGELEPIISASIAWVEENPNKEMATLKMENVFIHIKNPKPDSEFEDDELINDAIGEYNTKVYDPLQDPNLTHHKKYDFKIYYDRQLMEEFIKEQGLENKKKRKLEEKHIQKMMGLKYDKCILYSLTAQYQSSLYNLFGKDKKIIIPAISWQMELSKDEARYFLELVANPRSYGAGTCDCRIVPFVVVFFQKNKPVSQVFPNMSGGGVYFVPKQSEYYGGLSSDAYESLHQIFYHNMIKYNSRKKIK